ncbi:LAFA_0B02454g1_1 [Lachancea sp. 'fantastica']|nr:LAFA_0B02454g1_1 [Lachancea sp. 'fantastica']
MPTLEERLNTVLPSSVEFELLHLLSPSKETHPLVLESFPVRGNRRVVKAQHFFALASAHKIFYALEVYVYITLGSESCEKLVFVSKADTNGYCDHGLSMKDVTKALIEYVSSIIPDFYLQRVIERPERRKVQIDAITQQTTTKRALRILKNRLETEHKFSSRSIQDVYTKIERPSSQWSCKICLFTRSEPQYLFAESSHNTKKHILPGNKLLKWWLSVIDDILINIFSHETTARLQIPGEETLVTHKHIRNLKSRNWRVGDIFDGRPDDPAVFKIPLFPDDPKGRFLEQLVDEGRARKVSLSQFWVELQIQQEFRLGDTVSVIGVSGSIKPSACQSVADDEVIRTNSRKIFNMIKSYITGEEYDNEEGPLDAYTNVKDFLQLRLGRSTISIRGRKKLETSPRHQNSGIPYKTDSAQICKPKPQTLNAQLVRKKAKK